MRLPLNVIGLVQNFNVEQLQSMVNVMMLKGGKSCILQLMSRLAAL